MSALPEQTPPDYSAARLNMVESQLRTNKVTDTRILDRMSDLPRELFAPPLFAGVAYKDQDLQVGPTRYLMEPMVLARMLQEAMIRPTEKVLDVAPASGYSTAVISSLAKHVVGVESDPTLITSGIKNITMLGLTNAEMQLGPVRDGWMDQAPYNVILINGSVDIVPEGLFTQLAEGGRLLAVMRGYGPGHFHIGEARLYEKIHGAISQRALFDANIKPLPLQGFQETPKFTFS